MSNTKTLLTNALRTFLSRKGISGVTNAEIQEVIQRVSPDSFDVTDEQKAQIKEILLDKFQSKASGLTVQETKSLIQQEANKFEIDLNGQEVSEMLTFVQSQNNFVDDQISVIHQALVAFVEKQSSRKNEQLGRALTDVQNLAVQRDQEFQQNVGVAVSNFFRESNNNTSYFTSVLATALNESSQNDDLSSTAS